MMATATIDKSSGKKPPRRGGGGFLSGVIPIALKKLFGGGPSAPQVAAQSGNPWTPWNPEPSNYVERLPEQNWYDPGPSNYVGTAVESGNGFPWESVINAGMAGAAGLAGNATSEQRNYQQVDNRLPPTIVDMFSQMGYAPEQRAEYAQGIMPALMAKIFATVGGQGPMPDYVNIPRATSQEDLYGFDPNGSEVGGSGSEEGMARIREARRRAMMTRRPGS